MKIKLTTQEELELCNYYKKGMTTRDLCLKYGWSINNRHVPLDILKRNNISIRQDQKTHAFKYNVDDSFFETIDTKEKAYFLGLICADGSLSKQKNELRIVIQEKDKYILDIMNKHIKSNKPLRINKRSKINQNWKDIYTLNIENIKICKDLLKIIKSKDKENDFDFKIIERIKDTSLHSHFIRGFFDGDGSICKRGKTGKVMSFSGTFNFINGLNNYLFSLNKGLKLSKLYKRFKNRDTNNGYQIYYYLSKDNLDIYNWIYHDSKNLCLLRKKEIFKN